MQKKKDQEVKPLKFKGNVVLADALFSSLKSDIAALENERKYVDSVGMDESNMNEFMRKCERMQASYTAFLHVLRSGAFQFDVDVVP